MEKTSWKKKRINEQTKQCQLRPWKFIFVWDESKLIHTIIILASTREVSIKIKIQVLISGRTLNVTLLKGVTLKKEETDVVEKWI